MSLEAVIQENTATMRELIAALAHTQVRPATTQEVGDITVTSIKATPDAKPEPEKSEPVATKKPREYDEIKKPFLAMLKTHGQEAGAKLIEEFKVSKLSEIPVEDYDKVLAAIKRATA